MFKTKEGLNVFVVKHKEEIYQLTNAWPNPGDYCLVDTEHDPTYVTKVKSFDPEAEYPLNGNCKYGARSIENEFRHYGAAKIVWTSNQQLDLSESMSRSERYEYWSKKHPHLTRADI